MCTGVRTAVLDKGKYEMHMAATRTSTSPMGTLELERVLGEILNCDKWMGTLFLHISQSSL
jgi:hypothetical protein